MDEKDIKVKTAHTATYAGMPAVNEALAVFKQVLQERNEWPIK